MDQAEILRRIKDTNTADLDPDGAAEIYAHILLYLQESIPEADLHRLILLAAVMYKNGIAVREQLQIPSPRIDLDNPPKTYLQ
ncbi:hypothetical protein NCCP691_40560 [Noviherbaspirillum aridicola]|uniref:DUF2783 domain-containing protein n=2 Tax=Noviherbaspirillum aridicola TaxID=2849687 RepID=A0ABQ4Q9Y0_9BURK|nr:hypothetical protein NCCP691_40560 [Noviherbaspirillum aridicola]